MDKVYHLQFQHHGQFHQFLHDIMSLLRSTVGYCFIKHIYLDIYAFVRSIHR